MSFQMRDSGRVGQSAYWMYFGINIVLCAALLFGGIAAMLMGSIGVGILCILLVMPLGIYFRVIMMRRCRDIGWPIFLPWLSIGFAMVFGVIIGLQLGAHAVPPSPLFALPTIVNLLDFVLTIAIGCMPSRGAYVDYVDDPDFFAKAIRAHSVAGQTDSARPVALRAGVPQDVDQAPPRPGFGRKIA